MAAKTEQIVAGDEGAAGKRRPLSLSYYTVPELTPLEVIAVAADAGCRHVGLRLLGGQPGGSELPLVADAGLRRQVLAMFRDTGITPLDANTARVVPATKVEAFLPFLDVAAELGARHVLTTADDTDDGRLTDNLFALCEAAAARGLTVDLEFVPWLSVPDLLSAASLVRRCNHSALGIAVDALHFHRSGSEIAALSGLPAVWFRYVQICDAPHLTSPPGRDALIHEAVKERLLPGDGAIDLVGLIRALPPSLPLALEIPPSALAATVSARERVVQAVDKARDLLRRIGAE